MRQRLGATPLLALVNLSASLLGLPAVPGSTIDPLQRFTVAP
jgi:hypothetical protein